MTTSKHVISSLALATIFAAATFAATADAQTRRLDLGQAKAFAIKHNQALVALRHDVDASEQRVEKASAAFKPHFGLAAGGEADAAATTNEGRGLAYVYGSWNLFNGYRDQVGEEIAQVGRTRAQQQLRAAEHLIGLEVERFFQLYLFKKTQISLAERALSRNGDHQSLVKRSRALGAVSDADVMEFQLKEASLKSSMVALRQELEDARSNLKRLLGEQVGAAIEPVGLLQQQRVKGELKAYLDRIPRDTSAVRDAAKAVEIARLEREVASGRGLPTLDFETRAGLLEGADRIDGAKPQASFLLLAKWDIYQGGEVVAEERELAASALKAEAELKDAINQAIRKVEVGFRTMKALEQRADLEQNNVRFATRYYEAVVGEYKRGFKNSADLSEASAQLQESEERRVELDHASIEQRIAVEEALGSSLELLPPRPTPGGKP